MKIPRSTLLVLLILASSAAALAADSVAWDSSGNGLLSGTYNFREVMWRSKGDVHRVAIYGAITFDGNVLNGRYTLVSSIFDSNATSVQAFSTSGGYRISASGMGFLDDPIRLNAGSASSVVWGVVSHGVFVGSSTDDGINDLFVAAQAPAPAPTNASFNGSFRAVAANFPTGNVTDARDLQFALNPNGQGSLGSLSINGYIGGSGNGLTTETVNSAPYSFSNDGISTGVLTLSFGGSPQSQPLLSGDAKCYLSADGNFFFGGSATGWDMVVGLRTFPGAAPPDALQGTYYQAGIDVTPSMGFSSLATYYGAFSAGSGLIVGHQRLLTAFDPTAPAYAPFDYTYSDKFTIAPDATHDDFLGFHNFVGIGGAMRIGFAATSRVGINIAVRAPDFSGPGVYLSPTAIRNAASFAPATVGISRGGFVALEGTGLASGNQVDSSMPFTLGGVQVLINGRPAPIYYVSSTLVSAIVPFSTTGTIASVQIVNNDGVSDVRTVRVKDGTPGIYMTAAGTTLYAIAAHLSAKAVTPQNPALPGEIITVYLTGLGEVDPPVGDGVPPPSNPLSYSIHKPLMVVDGENVTPSFWGLAPTLTGVYVVNLTIPTDITTPGDVYLDIALPDSYTTEAQITIGTGNSAKPAVRKRSSPAERSPGTLRRFPNP
ncbi:MAG TPA: hypothetical protein VGJ09_14125 [Bryobacteraceae bacterium]